MKSSFHHRPLGGPFDDPTVFVRFLRERRAVLFDCGDLSGLGLGEMQKITDVFVTHTHIDHFIGFDSLLRAVLRRETPLRIYGPEDIIERVEGKIAGYTWNLITEYPVKLEVFGIGEEIIRRAEFNSGDSLKRLDMETAPFSGIALSEEDFVVRALMLEHGVQSLGYSIEELSHINIDKDALTRAGLPVGPWLSDLKKAVRRNAPDGEAVSIEGAARRFGDLKSMAIITKGQKVSYIMDTSPTPENISKITDFVRDSDTLYIEAYFLHEDIERARLRNHLTARMAGEIAKEAGVKFLRLLHFSPKYLDRQESAVKEAMEAFGGKAYRNPQV